VSALCTLTDVKAYLRIADGAQDAVINYLIPKASAFLERQCSRIFASATYSETRNGNGADSMGLRQIPVTAVASVSVDGVSIPAAPDAVSTGFVFDEDTLYIRRGNRGLSSPFGGVPLCFNRGIQNIALSYTAGYATIPDDLVQACVELVAWKMKKSSRIDSKSETLAQQTVAYDMSDVPAGCASIISRYSRTMIPP
jgi:uncharacterized phiE125 gp8 family phage protein